VHEHLGGPQVHRNAAGDRARGDGHDWPKRAGLAERRKQCLGGRLVPSGVVGGRVVDALASPGVARLLHRRLERLAAQTRANSDWPETT
jgi:hypothetical protein